MRVKTIIAAGVVAAAALAVPAMTAAHPSAAHPAVPAVADSGGTGTYYHA